MQAVRGGWGDGEWGLLLGVSIPSAYFILMPLLLKVFDAQLKQQHCTPQCIHVTRGFHLKSTHVREPLDRTCKAVDKTCQVSVNSGVLVLAISHVFNGSGSSGTCFSELLHVDNLVGILFEISVCFERDFP